jgi:preprotein translocase subunit SecG
MKTILLFVVVAAVLLVAFVILRSSRSTTNHLNVDSNAAGEIEKAKGR